jgi:hypothetical protein
MTVPNNPLDLSRNNISADAITLTYDAMTNVAVPAATQPSIVCGTGVPTFSAKKGTVYVRLDGAAATMMYINNNGATTWSVVTSA